MSPIKRTGVSLERSVPEGVEQMVSAPDSVEQKRLHSMQRFVAYTASLCAVVFVLMLWFTGIRLQRAETRQYETTASMFAQMEKRVAALEDRLRPAAPPRPKTIEFVPPASAPRVGSAEAKVTIVEFADFKCPYCSKFHSDIYKQLVTDYVDTGKASFVYQDFAFLGEESLLAAQAARCAGDQGKFWQYHDYLFENQGKETKDALTVKNLKQFARSLQLNTQTFNTCLDTAKYEKTIVDETAAIRTLGVTGTPSVSVNGKLLVGALPYEQFVAAIEEVLNK